MADKPEKETGTPADADESAIVPGDPVATAENQPNPIEVAEEEVKEPKGLKARGQEAQEAVGSMDPEERQRLLDIAKAGEETLATKTKLISADAHYAEKRKLYGEDTSAVDDETERLRVLNEATLEAHRQAQERAAATLASAVPVDGQMKPGDVDLLITTPEKQRHHSVMIRALGEVENGFIRVYDKKLKDDIKGGRVGESPQFGTKNRVRVAETDDKGMVTKVVTYPGHYDLGPLRLPPGDYEASVEGWDGGILATESFKIDPMNKVDPGPEADDDVNSRRIASMAAQQFARQTTKSETGEVLPAPKAPKAEKATAEKER